MVLTKNGHVTNNFKKKKKTFIYIYKFLKKIMWFLT
jgi:hypothetical protein